MFDFSSSFIYASFQNKFITCDGQLGSFLFVFKYHYEFVNLIPFGGFHSITVILTDPQLWPVGLSSSWVLCPYDVILDIIFSILQND